MSMARYYVYSDIMKCALKHPILFLLRALTHIPSKVATEPMGNNLQAGLMTNP